MDARGVLAAKISTMSAGRGFVFIGSHQGEFMCRKMSIGSATHVGIITTDRTGITNHVEIQESRSGETIAVISSNDRMTRMMNMHELEIVKEFPSDWPVNCSALSPDKRLLCLSGDDQESVIVSADTGDDMTTRIYDIRNPSKSLATLSGNLGSIRSLRFTDDGAFLAAAEQADFVHIYDFKSGVCRLQEPGGKGDGWVGLEDANREVVDGAFRCQVVNFFGEITGIAFTPDGADSLYIGNTEEMQVEEKYGSNGSILEFMRNTKSTAPLVDDMLF
ncbi:hypothetical protein HDU76_002512 [Blyttiomyces sp. JEL0837]|nr:hypothetical protein HDU76_002512 [Blyttiomyces sp. JEL0837]